MARVKHRRDKKRQMGQFFTPSALAKKLIDRQDWHAEMRVLEPGFGDGSFLFLLIEKFLPLRNHSLAAVLTENIWGVEIDPELYSFVLAEIERRWGSPPSNHNLTCGDYLDTRIFSEVTSEPDLFGQSLGFDMIIGNPPFGGTVSLQLQDILEKKYGRRHGEKIKRETYSLFIVKSMDLLRKQGVLEFICSDTFLTIPTMKGLRNALMIEGETTVTRLPEFSEETNYPMVVMRYLREGKSKVVVDGTELSIPAVRSTGNYSWQVCSKHSALFQGPDLSHYLTASSGMTTGKNEYFVREIVDGCVEEPFDFYFFDDPVTLKSEIQKARLGVISGRKMEEIKSAEAKGATQRNVKIVRREKPVRVALPHPHYRPYNKAQPGRLFAPPKYAIYWRDEGDAVRTYKKNGKWYLRGMGGAPFFGREGITWRLICARLDMRYLPAGYILDSGAPCAFLKEGVDHDELWFILGWCISDLATSVLKSVINHTMNIQSKDVERLPYPWWVSPERKRRAIQLVRDSVEAAIDGQPVSDAQLTRIGFLYEYAPVPASLGAPLTGGAIAEIEAS